MTNDRIPLLIEELGSELNLPGMRLDDAGVCVISTENSLEIVLNDSDEDEDQLVISAHLGSIPEDRREVVYAELLKANFGHMQTRGTTLSVAGRQRHVFLQKEVRGDELDLAKALTTLEEFFQRAAFCAEGLQGLLESSPQLADQPLQPTMFA